MFARHQWGFLLVRLIVILANVNAVIFGQVSAQTGRITELSSRDGSVFLTYNVGRGSVSVVRNGQVHLINTIKVSAASDAGWLAEIKDNTDPTLSPNGEQVALVARRAGTKVDEAIVIYDLRDHTAREVVHVPYSVVRLAWSPMGEGIAFVAQPERFVVKLYSVDLETRQISPVDPEHEIVSASWSPDGKEIAVAEPQRSSAEGASQGGMFVFNRQTKSRRKIGEGVWPTWSPNGEFIAYLDEAQENCYIVNPDGSNRRRLFSYKQNRFARLFSWYSLMYPLLWSPDMRCLLYHREAGDTGHQSKIFLFDLKSKKTEEISIGGQWEVADWRAGNR